MRKVGLVSNMSDYPIYAIGAVRNWADFGPTHKPWPMDRPHGLSDK